jgi:AmmeMemoRadiSam system protein B
MLRASFRLIPLAFGPVPYEVRQELGRAIVDAVRRTIHTVVPVASTDMRYCGNDCRHLRPAGVTAQTYTYQEDRYAIDRLLALGAKPITGALLACQELGATAATLVRDMTSRDICGNLDTAVGYTGVLVA